MLLSLGAPLTPWTNDENTFQILLNGQLTCRGILLETLEIPHQSPTGGCRHPHFCSLSETMCFFYSRNEQLCRCENPNKVTSCLREFLCEGYLQHFYKVLCGCVRLKLTIQAYHLHLGRASSITPFPYHNVRQTTVSVHLSLPQCKMHPYLVYWHWCWFDPTLSSPCLCAFSPYFTLICTILVEKLICTSWGLWADGSTWSLQAERPFALYFGRVPWLAVSLAHQEPLSLGGPGSTYQTVN